MTKGICLSGWRLLWKYTIRFCNRDEFGLKSCDSPYFWATRISMFAMLWGDFHPSLTGKCNKNFSFIGKFKSVWNWEAGRKQLLNFTWALCDLPPYNWALWNFWISLGTYVVCRFEVNWLDFISTTVKMLW